MSIAPPASARTVVAQNAPIPIRWPLGKDTLCYLVLRHLRLAVARVWVRVNLDLWGGGSVCSGGGYVSGDGGSRC